MNAANEIAPASRASGVLGEACDRVAAIQRLLDDADRDRGRDGDPDADAIDVQSRYTSLRETQRVDQRSGRRQREEPEHRRDEQRGRVASGRWADAERPAPLVPIASPPVVVRENP